MPIIPECERIVLDWLADDEGDPTTTPLRWGAKLLLETAQAEVERLLSALLKYGDHTAYCSHEPIIGRLPQCSCGWMELEAAEKKRRRSDGEGVTDGDQER